MKHLKVIQNYETCYPDPISFKVGDILIIGRKDDEYKGWVRVTTCSGNEGWAPEQYFDLSKNSAVATANYSANELTTKVGETLELINTLNEWAWVKNSDGELGWIPYETTEQA